MQRSASTCRASDEFFINLSPASKGSPGGIKIAAADIIDISKKDVKLPGENLIHLIPLILIFCVITLWVFSHPVVDFSKEDGKLEGAKIQNIVNGTVLSSVMKLKDLDQHQGIGKGRVDENSG
ncbi:hypothetical protein ACHQM5_030625 [Ranunculus cassubicifolius]